MKSEGNKRKKKQSSMARDIPLRIRNLLKRDMRRVVDLFQAFDKNGDGSVGRKEFAQGLKELGISVSRKEMGSLYKALDLNKDGKIAYLELYFALKDVAEPPSPTGKVVNDDRRGNRRGGRGGGGAKGTVATRRAGGYVPPPRASNGKAHRVAKSGQSPARGRGGGRKGPTRRLDYGANGNERGGVNGNGDMRGYGNAWRGRGRPPPATMRPNLQQGVYHHPPPAAWGRPMPMPNFQRPPPPGYVGPYAFMTVSQPQSNVAYHT